MENDVKRSIGFSSCDDQSQLADNEKVAERSRAINPATASLHPEISRPPH